MRLPCAGSCSFHLSAAHSLLRALSVAPAVSSFGKSHRSGWTEKPPQLNRWELVKPSAHWGLNRALMATKHEAHWQIKTEKTETLADTSYSTLNDTGCGKYYPTLAPQQDCSHKERDGLSMVCQSGMEILLTLRDYETAALWLRAGLKLGEQERAGGSFVGQSAGTCERSGSNVQTSRL